MKDSLVFKTSGECRVELVAHTNTVVRGLALWGASGDSFENSDFLPVSAARASFGKEDKTGEEPAKDIKLLKYLVDNRHVSCYEHNYATFLIECPLFVRSQIIRHRSFTFNEMSRRYTSEDIEFWIPDKWRKQSKSNKQASTDEYVTEWPMVTDRFYFNVVEMYHKMLELGVCREQARAILPQSLLTRFYMTGNLRSWWSFLNSRLKEDTQYETRVPAQKIKKELDVLWPESMKALMGDKQDG